MACSNPSSKVKTDKPGEAEPAPRPSGVEPYRWTAPASGCVVTICLTGAIDQSTPSNRYFEELCSDPRIEGLVEDCGRDAGRCDKSFDSFLKNPVDAIYPVLFAVLDRNEDGRVDKVDPVCRVRLLGFSWGGLNAVLVATALAQDERVASSHRGITRLLLMDPYQPGASARMVIPDNVERTVVWRHSKAPKGDCSTSAPLGPYIGFAPRCKAEQDCEVVDYSATPAAIFRTSRGRALRGDAIGHCMVSAVAADAALDEL